MVSLETEQRFKNLDPAFNQDSYNAATLNTKVMDGIFEITVRLARIGIVDAYIELGRPGVVIIEQTTVEENTRSGIGTALLARALEAGKDYGATIADFEAITDRSMIGVIEQLIKAGIIKEAAFIVARSDESPLDIVNIPVAEVIISPDRLTAAEVRAIPHIAEEGGVRLRAVAIL